MELRSDKTSFMAMTIWNSSRAWWLISIIPATQEAEIRRIVVQGQPGQKVTEVPSQPTTQMQ
jgi:hypothetical protein